MHVLRVTLLGGLLCMEQKKNRSLLQLHVRGSVLLEINSPQKPDWVDNASHIHNSSRHCSILFEAGMGLTVLLHPSHPGTRTFRQVLQPGIEPATSPFLAVHAGTRATAQAGGGPQNHGPCRAGCPAEEEQGAGGS